MQYIVIDRTLNRIVTGYNAIGKLTFTDMDQFSETGAINITLYSHYSAQELIMNESTENLNLIFITLKEYYTNPVYKLNA